MPSNSINLEHTKFAKIASFNTPIAKHQNREVTPSSLSNSIYYLEMAITTIRKIHRLFYSIKGNTLNIRGQADMHLMSPKGKPLRAHQVTKCAPPSHMEVCTNFSWQTTIKRSHDCRRNLKFKERSLDHLSIPKPIN